MCETVEQADHAGLTEVFWRPGTLADVPAVAELADKAFLPLYRESWSARQMSELLARHASWLLLAELSDRKLVAFALCREVAGDAELLLCACHPHHRRRRLGRRMIARVVEECLARRLRRLFLEVRAGNEAALRLYTETGFQIQGRRANYYWTLDGNSIDAITMSRQL